jgi:hypothetical protein
MEVDPIFRYLPKAAAASYRALGQRVLDLEVQIEKSKTDVTWLKATLTWAKENEEHLKQQLQSARAEVKRELAGAETAYIIYIMGDSEAAAEQNRTQLREARQGVDTSSQTMHAIAHQMELTAVRLEQLEFEQAQIERARKQWMCESCLSAHVVSADDGSGTCCDTCGLPRSISDAQRVESENFRTHLSLAKQARAMEGRWAAVQGRVGQIKLGVLLNDDIAVRLQYSDDLSLSAHFHLYELDGPPVATEAEAAGTGVTAGKDDVDSEDEGSEINCSASASVQKSGSGYAQQSREQQQNLTANRATGPEAVKLHLLTLRREMGEMEWALTSAEKEQTNMIASVKRLESEAMLIQCELKAKGLAGRLADAAETRRRHEEQLKVAKTSGADAAAEIQVKKLLLSKTEVEMHQLATKMCKVKARTDAMAARVAEVRVMPTALSI